MMMRWTGLFVVVAIWLLPLSLVAQDYPSLSTPPQIEQTGQNDAALIVGIGDYVFLPDVDGVVETVNDWEVFFERGLGMSSSQVFTLMDQRATREQMEEFAHRAAGAVGEGGTLWFVFVGHGAPTTQGDDGVLVGVDAQSNPRSLEVRGLQRGELVQILEQGEQAQTLVFIDACFSGQSQGGEALARGMQPVVPDRADQEFEPRSSTVVMAAAQADEFAGALPGMERPAFSYVMLGALRGWAADDGELTASQAIGYARRTLRHLDHTQTPSLAGGDEVVLVRGAVEEEPGLSAAMRAMQRGETGRSTVAEASQEEVVRDQERTLPEAQEADEAVLHQQEQQETLLDTLGIDGTLLSREEFDRAQSEFTSEELRELLASLKPQSERMVGQLETLITSQPDNPNRPDLMFQKAELQWEITNLSRQIACQERRGVECGAAGSLNYSDSLALYEAILQDYPDYGRLEAVLFRLGSVYLDRGEGAKAAPYLQRLLADYPSSRTRPEAKLKLGDHFLEQGMTDEARQHYLPLLDDDDESMRGYVWYRLGWVGYLSDNDGSARRYWSKALDFVQQEIGAEFHREVIQSLPEGVDLRGQ